MKLGLSSYSLYRDIQNGVLPILDVPRWIAAHGGEHLEIVPLGFSLVDNPGLTDDLLNAADKAGIAISNYAVGANFAIDDEADYRRAIEETKVHVDVANRLGVKLMRHDVASRPTAEATIQRFEADLPRLVEACREVADYAAQYGITTSVENHGYYIQASDRVQRLVSAVDRPNFRTTLDVGNFMCVDENPLIAVRKNLPIASMVHLKDFYLRPASAAFTEGWFRSAGGNYLRGAIAGHGDIPLQTILAEIKASGYDGYISLEFEGMEDCQLGSRIGLQQVRHLWEAI
ncbi:sugar phosphate isomerase/epimerase [Paenibacillus sp. MWE-103]|uniref:Sugar phosphate isomerase/epimerase n=1 Tax=Paenibacillus artemisiicola TaxID=1172618 RepID=A0ABS3W4I6_9BACL|nr:sugar phosphate isomerase/epimerase [Paenibacillus artemisiicola]MBO7743202.1 sugar phosphate isomerase/epimerase [Paenibacillus artemisiicola]